MKTMDDILRLALSKIKDDGARDRVEPGTYRINACVTITGEMTVGADYTRPATTSLPHIEILALALHLAGVQQDRAISIIREAVSGCLANNDSAVGCIRSSIPTIETEIARIKNEIVAQLPKQNCKGSVKFTPELTGV
jgi:hypothetical protein